MSHCHEKCGEGFASCLQCCTRNKLPCYSQFLTERRNLRPTNPKHFYLGLEANICSHSSLRKLVEVSFFFNLQIFLYSTKAVMKEGLFLGTFALSSQSVIFQPQSSVPLVVTELPSSSHEGFPFSCTKLQKEDNGEDFYCSQFLYHRAV